MGCITEKHACLIERNYMVPDYQNHRHTISLDGLAQVASITGKCMDGALKKYSSTSQGMDGTQGISK